MKERQDTAPFLKWAGGKRQLLHEITKLLPKDIGSRKYYELFVGGGALLFHLQPVNGFINDSNPELTNAYRTVRDNLGELLEALRQHEALNSAEHFYEVRALDRDPGLGRLSPVERAARMIYLNQTCYNGLYRVNGSGFFNTPYGKYRNPHIADTTRLTAASRFLNANCIRIACGDYADLVGEISTRSFVYLDPPYHPTSRDRSFTAYVKGGWTEEDQIRLRDFCNLLDSHGVPFLLSNSSTEFIGDIYHGYRIHTVRATRMISSKGNGRSPVEEVLIFNYDPTQL